MECQKAGVFKKGQNSMFLIQYFDILKKKKKNQKNENNKKILTKYIC